MARDGMAALLARSVAVSAVVVAVLFNLDFATNGLSGNNTYLLDETAARRAVETRTMTLLNTHLPDTARVLLVGEAEIFDARRDVLYNTVFDRSLFQAMAATDPFSLHDPEIPLKPADDIRAVFREAGVTHVLVNWLEILRYREPGSYGYTEFVTPERLQALVELGLLSPVPLDPSETHFPVERLSANRRELVETWGKGLQTTIRGERTIAAYALYAVN
jgi:hypothetical protein